MELFPKLNFCIKRNQILFLFSLVKEMEREKKKLHRRLTNND